MAELTAIAQLAFTVVIGFYIVLALKSNIATNEKGTQKESVAAAESLNRLRHISLNKPMSECSRPSSISDIIGQSDGVRALRAALWGENPQHVLIYGPPGVGKTAAARIVMEDIKNSPGTPFSKDAVFVEADAAIMRCDEHGFADPLIGSVHDPIYQGAGAMGLSGVPQPKPGMVTKAHGGILFLDEIGELKNEQINKLLKVLEDRRVMLESSYYSKTKSQIPTYIKDVFENGLPADFRLIGATTRKPSEIPEAIRSRCVEIFFSPLSRESIVKIVSDAAKRCTIKTESGVFEAIADYTENGRDAIKLLQSAENLAEMENKSCISIADIEWNAKASRYVKRR